MVAPLTPDTLKVIRRNAGRVLPHEIARSLGWTTSQLERVCRDRMIDLAVAPVAPTAPAYFPRADRRDVRSEQVTIALLPCDIEAIEAIGRDIGQRRARVISRIIENARARGLLADLAKLPAPLPEHIADIDEGG